MASDFPALDSTTHIDSVTYACTFGLTTAGRAGLSLPGAECCLGHNRRRSTRGRPEPGPIIPALGGTGDG